MLEFLRSMLLVFREKDAAVIRFMVDEVDHITVAATILRGHRALQVAANDSADSVDRRILPRILLGLRV